MSRKRSLGKEREEEEGDDSSDQPPKRQYILIDAAELETLVSKAVQKGIENALDRFSHTGPRLPMKQTHKAVRRPYRLRFKSKLPPTLYTKSRIEARGNKPIEIIIVDTVSNEIMTSGPLSITKIEIFVLDGDFGGDGEGEWSAVEFSDSLVRQREGKGPLLTGELVISLKSGVGCIGNATFTDNSSWTRSGKFRLGVRVVQSSESEGMVHEAITEAFSVKDHRVEPFKKNHPPELSDEVWRLENIRKDGVFHKKLAELGINTVQDFLRFFALDLNQLCELMGGGLSKKKWDITIEHARECSPNGKLYSYSYSSGGQNIVLFFDSIFQLNGVTIDNISHRPDGLDDLQKDLVDKLKKLACMNPSDIVEFNGYPVGSFPRPWHIRDAAVSLQEPYWPVPQNQVQPATYQVLVSPHTQPQAPLNHILGDPIQLDFIDVQYGGLAVNELQEASFPSSELDLINLQSGGLTMNGVQKYPSFTSSELQTVWGYGLQTSCSGFESILSPLPVQASCGAEARRVYDPRLPGSGSCKWGTIIILLKWKAKLKLSAATRRVISGFWTDP